MAAGCRGLSSRAAPPGGAGARGALTRRRRGTASAAPASRPVDSAVGRQAAKPESAKTAQSATTAKPRDAAPAKAAAQRTRRPGAAAPVGRDHAEVSERTSADSLGYLLRRVGLVEDRIRALVTHRRADDPAPDDPFRGLYLTDEVVDQLLAPRRRRPRAPIGQRRDAVEARGRRRPRPPVRDPACVAWPRRAG